jgi:hypothetical protein
VTRRAGLLVSWIVVLAVSRATGQAKGIPLGVKQTQYCSAFAPSDWSFTSNPQASAADAYSGDRSSYAGWGGLAVNRSMQQYYGDLYGDPETSIRTIAGVAVKGLGDPSEVRYTSGPEPFLNYFTLRRLESAQFAGLVFYRVYPGPGPGMYVESVYLAFSHKRLGSGGVGLAAGVAVSLRCQTQLVPVRFDPPSRGSGKRSPRAGCGSGGNLRGYNKELGTQYAHSPSTGQNFLLDPSTDWQENGPQGPGYYRGAGNSTEKLELGRDDDC